MQKHPDKVIEVRPKCVEMVKNLDKIWRTWFFFSLQRTTLPNVPRPSTLKGTQKNQSIGFDAINISNILQYSAHW